MKRRIDTWQISAFHQHLKEEGREASTTPAMAFCFSSKGFYLFPKCRFCPEDSGGEIMGHSRQKLDLAGQRYGKLTVIGPAPNVGNRTAWLCRCDCGRETVVTSGHLRSGHTSSCGCRGLGAASAGAGLLGLTFVDGTCVEMLRAKTIRKNNTSGVPGVDWLARKRLWRASICSGITWEGTITSRTR